MRHNPAVHRTLRDKAAQRPVTSTLGLSNPTHIPLYVHIKGLFARDKQAFWFNHFTDEEKELRRMDAWQLAKVIHEADVHKNNSEKRIVAEHLLNVRLAQIQSKASWGSGVLGFVGAIIGAVLSVVKWGHGQMGSDTIFHSKTSGLNNTSPYKSMAIYMGMWLRTNK
ncbi:MAG: hypothetical protein Q7T58_04850 [Methylotenera sp.]|nr:hypothetical protein [Methylotenera sp.]